MKFFYCFFYLSTIVILAKAQDYPLMPYDQYNKIFHEVPYCYSFKKLNQKLYYYGCKRSRSPEDKQYLKLEALWKHFLDETRAQNCVVVVPFRPWKKGKNKIEAILNGNASGYITYLAEARNIKVICSEPELNEIVDDVLLYYDKDIVAYTFFVQKAFDLLQSHEPYIIFDFEEQMKPFMKFMRVILNKTYTFESIKKIHQKLFKDPFFPDLVFFFQIINPFSDFSIINEVIRHMSDFTNKKFLSCIENLIRANKNIFIINDYTAAVRQKKAIIGLWQR